MKTGYKIGIGVFGVVLALTMFLVIGSQHTTTTVPIESVYPELADTSIPLPDFITEEIVETVDSDGTHHRHIVTEEPSLIDRIISPAPVETMAEADWAKENLFDSSIVVGYSDITNDSSGNLHVCFGAHITDGPVNSTLWYAKYNGTWNKEIVDDGAYANRVGKYQCSIGVNSTDDIMISYYDDDADELRFATGEYKHWLNETIDSAGNVGSYTSIAINSTGKAIISYYDLTNTALKVASGSYGHWQTEIVDNTGNAGYYTSITINSTDKVSISNYDATANSLRGAYGSYGHWTLESIRVPAGVITGIGSYSSITTNSTDKLHIAYMKHYENGTNTVEFSTGDYGHWSSQEIDYVGAQSAQYYSIDNYNNNITFTYHTSSADNILVRNSTLSSLTSWTLDTIDSAGDTGYYTSLVVVNGTAHAVYFDDTNNKIKHASRQLFLPYGGGGGAPTGWWNFYENVSFENPSVSASTVNFNITLNYSVVDNPLADVTFTYNGVSYNPLVAEHYDNITVWSIDVTVPDVTAIGTTTYPIWWNGTDIDTFGNTTVMFHTVSVLDVTECDGADEVLIFNTTHWQENNVTVAANVSLDISFLFREIDGIVSTQSFNFSSYPAVSHAYCVPSGIANWFSADVEMFYYDQAALYDQKTYYLLNHNFTLTSNTTDITPTYSLYNYLDQTFRFTVWAEDLSKLQGYVQINKYYIGDGLYRTVQVMKTDEEGIGLGSIELNNPYYQYVILNSEGVVLYTSQRTRMYCATLPCTYMLLVKSGQSGMLPFEHSASISYNLSWDQASDKYASFSFLDSSGGTSQGYMEVVHSNSSGEFLVYNGSVNASSGTLEYNATNTCGYTSDCTVKISGWMNVGGVPILVWQTIGEVINAANIFGDEGIFWAMGITITTVLIGVWVPAAAFFLLAMAMIMVTSMGVVAIPVAAVAAIICIIVVMLWRTRS